VNADRLYELRRRLLFIIPRGALAPVMDIFYELSDVIERQGRRIEGLDRSLNTLVRERTGFGDAEEERLQWGWFETADGLEGMARLPRSGLSPGELVHRPLLAISGTSSFRLEEELPEFTPIRTRTYRVTRNDADGRPRLVEETQG
jgi:hypothetical protein